MELLHISDTHGLHKKLIDLPKADVIVHTGDFTEDGYEEEAKDFIEWFSNLPYAHKIFISGNHDFGINESTFDHLPDNMHYLCNSGIIIDGIKFYGMPMVYDDDIDFLEFMNRIPDDTDVLLTHQAPLGILDQQDGINYGDYTLYKRVIAIEPKYHLFGHIHHTKDTYAKFFGIQFSNAANSKYGDYNLLKIH